MTCSVVVPTRNRAQVLATTLALLRALEIPRGWETELVVVDNGSIDETAQLASRVYLGASAGRMIHVPQPGLSRARNAGARATSGDVLLFLDDDVRPPTNWLADMVGPIRSGAADATAGLFIMEEETAAAWMSDSDRRALVSEESIDPARPFLAGGNMAIRRDLFGRIGGFEEELGRGALGGGEDLLLTERVKEAGGTILCVRTARARHWVDLTKLTHAALVERVASDARSDAWLSYHWFGRSDRHALVKEAILTALTWVPLRPPRRPKLGVRSWQAELAVRRAWHAQMRIEQRRPRKFVRSQVAAA